MLLAWALPSTTCTVEAPAPLQLLIQSLMLRKSTVASHHAIDGVLAAGHCLEVVLVRRPCAGGGEERVHVCALSVELPVLQDGPSALT